MAQDLSALAPIAEIIDLSSRAAARTDPLGDTRSEAGGAQPPSDSSAGALPTALRDLVDQFTTFADTTAKGGDWTKTGFVKYTALPWWQDAPKLSECEAGQRLAKLAPADKARVAVYAYVEWVRGTYSGPKAAPLRRIASEMMRGKLDLEPDQAMVLAAAAQTGFASMDKTPNRVLASALKRHVDMHGLTPQLRLALSCVRASMVLRRVDSHLDGRELLSAIDAMLAHHGLEVGERPRYKPKPDAWGHAIEGRLAHLSFERRAELTPLLALAEAGGEAAKPTKTWLKQAQQEIARGNRERAGALLLEIIGDYEPGAKIELENRNTLRALMWLAAMASSDAAIRLLEAYAVKCLTWVGYDYLSLVLGNAAIHAFTLMPGTEGVGSLTRLKRRLSRPGEIKTVEKAIAALGEARGMTPGEIEEVGLPDYGFGPEGWREIIVGSARARLVITESSALETIWSGADGQPLSGPPAAVKEAFAEGLAALKAEVKEIGETLKSQRMRLESLYLEERTWSLDVWRRRYLEEPLMRALSRRLIWSLGTGGHWTAAIAMDGGLYDVAGKRLDADRGSLNVRLWHPMQSDPANVIAWRRKLAELGVTQPFKQAHREIYVLTNAEAETATYSNRFAGHFVEQAKFRALCHARNWACPAFGVWAPSRLQACRRLAALGMQVDLDIEPLDPVHAWGHYDERMINERHGMSEHVLTGQMRFLRNGEVIPLVNVSPVVFSEMMRDADLFVGVSSIANDPTWAERTGAERLGDYWHSTAAGPLTETGKSRREALKDLLPGLAIASRCRLEDRYLVVEGDLATYKIHLGSANIIMAPSNQYLCIIADGIQKRASAVRLPFEGDMTLSLILSKAFLLANDKAIKDPSIVSQILRGRADDATRNSGRSV